MFDATVTPLRHAPSPYKDISLQRGRNAHLTLRDVLSDEVAYSHVRDSEQATDLPIGTGHYICETIRPGLQYIDCNLRMTEAFVVAALWPKCIFLTAVHEGKAVSRVDGQTFHHPAGGVPQIMGLGQDTEVLSDEAQLPGQRVRMSGLMITPQFFEELEGDLMQGLRPLRAMMNPGVFHQNLRQNAGLRDLLHRLHTAPYQGAMSTLYRESLGTAALIDLAAEFAGPGLSSAPTGPAEDDLAHAVRAVVVNNPLAVTSARDLALQLGTNETSLRRSFKSTFGEPLFSFVRRSKLDHARNMIRGGQHQIAEVAYHCGYSDPANFTHAYRRQFGCSPRADLT
ncbi:MAG: AraC family transcriptional regulator [Pseudomonadota bacterium]